MDATNKGGSEPSIDRIVTQCEAKGIRAIASLEE